MKFHGYKRKDTGNGLLEMKEVSVSANPAVLRALADFIRTCADGIEKDPMRWGHEHFTPPSGTTGKNTPSFIVCNTRKE